MAGCAFDFLHRLRTGLDRIRVRHLFQRFILFLHLVELELQIKLLLNQLLVGFFGIIAMRGETAERLTVFQPVHFLLQLTDALIAPLDLILVHLPQIMRFVLYAPVARG